MPHNSVLVNGTSVAKATATSRYENTGTFGAFRKPRVVGVSDDVAYSTTILARSASRELRRWKRTLPKGVRI